jgi:hypothetical protein
MHRIPNVPKMGAILSCAMVAYAAAVGIGNAVADESVITYHNAANRSGLYLAPTLTWTKAPAVKLDTFRCQGRRMGLCAAALLGPARRRRSTPHRRHRAELRLCAQPLDRQADLGEERSGGAAAVDAR